MKLIRDTQYGLLCAYFSPYSGSLAELMVIYALVPETRPTNVVGTSSL